MTTVWKIIQYNKDGTIKKVRLGDTKQDFERSLKAVKTYKTYTYKVFISHVNWEEKIDGFLFKKFLLY